MGTKKVRIPSYRIKRRRIGTYLSSTTAVTTVVSDNRRPVTFCRHVSSIDYCKQQQASGDAVSWRIFLDYMQQQQASYDIVS